jgi:Tol biopolymer transport system component
MIGTKLSHYEITGRLGAGGMGEVYQATDSKLGRSVAIKLLPETFTHDAERVARFDREARVLASISHPNIAAIHGIEEFQGRKFLVIELVPGETLADRIRRGATPLDEAIGIMKQIADALDTAHSKGIVHRDLKPENIKLTPDGQVKVLDFGLAKANETESPPPTLSNSPTMNISATHPGIILGTAAYMSPEQALGKPVDKRADIWAFGVVVYELVTGRRPFRGDTVAETLASTLKEEPQWDAVPSQLRPMLRRCLEKDPRRRLRDIGDAMPLVESQSEPPRRSSPLPWAVAIAALVLLSFLIVPTWRYFSRPGLVVSTTPGRFNILPPELLARNGAMALSPDGHRLAFYTAVTEGTGHVWVRTMDTGDTRQLPIAVAPGGLASLFWSSDSRFLMLQPGPDQKLHKIDMVGGPPQALCDVADYVTGGAVTDQGVILFGTNTGPLMRLDPGAAKPVPLTKLDASRDESNHSWPVLLRGTNHFLYLRITRDRERTGLFAGSLDAKPDQQRMKPILETRWGAMYVPPRADGPGTLLFRRDGALMMQSFDPQKLELVGEARLVVERVGAWNSYAFFSASQNGNLVYRVGEDAVQRFTWIDRMGKTLGSTSIHGYEFALSPDNNQVVFQAVGTQGLLLLDLDRGTTQRFTTGVRATYPVWFHDKKAIAYAASPHGVLNIYKKPTDGSAEELLWESDDNKLPTSISSDGRLLMYTSFGAETGYDLWVLPIGGKASPLKKTPFSESDAQFSPGGPYIAYESNENGKENIYLQEFSPSDLTLKGAPVSVSTNGGVSPQWNGDGTELFYRSEDNRVYVVKVSTAGKLQVGIPAPLPVLPGGTYLDSFSVTSDGKRFLFHYQDVPNAEPTLSALWNWQ